MPRAEGPSVSIKVLDSLLPDRAGVLILEGRIERCPSDLEPRVRKTVAWFEQKLQEKLDAAIGTPPVPLPPLLASPMANAQSHFPKERKTKRTKSMDVIRAWMCGRPARAGTFASDGTRLYSGGQVLAEHVVDLDGRRDKVYCVKGRKHAQRVCIVKLALGLK